MLLVKTEVSRLKKYVNLCRLDDQKGLRIIFFNRDVTTTFPNLYELKRGRVVHLDVGIHVAYVVVPDQVHVHVTSVSL